MILPPNIKERSVQIVKANGGESISSDLYKIMDNMVGASGRALLSRFTIDEDVTPFILNDESYPFNITNSTTKVGESLTKTGGGKWGDRIKSLTELGSALANTFGAEDSYGGAWNPWMNQVPLWSSTEISDLTFNFTFKLGQYGLWNAGREVVLPTLALIVPTIPRKMSPFMMTGPFPSATAMLVSFIKSLTKTMGSEDAAEEYWNKSTLEGVTDLTGNLSNAVLTSLKNHAYHISIGNIFTLMYAIPKSAKVNVSTNLDTDGLPIETSVELTFQGTIPPSLEQTSKAVPIGLRFGKPY